MTVSKSTGAKSAVRKPAAVRVEAARAKLIIDRRLKQQTPDWIKRVAQGLPSQPPEKPSRTPPNAVRIEAARAKLIIDRRLKQQTPDWIERVAQGLPPQ